MAGTTGALVLISTCGPPLPGATCTDCNRTCACKVPANRTALNGENNQRWGRRFNVFPLYLWEEFVLFNDCGHSDFSLRSLVLYPYHFAAAAHSDAFGQRNLRWQSQREINARAGSDGRIHEETHAPRAYVT